MKVTRQMLHRDLRSRYRLLTIVTSIMSFAWAIKLVNKLAERLRGQQAIDGLDIEERYFNSSDGAYRVRVVIYRPAGATGKLPAMLYCHGGGYVTGYPEQFGEVIERFIKTRPCVVVAPDHLKAFTEPFPAGFNDCYEALLWARDNASELNIDPDRFMVAGHSAGGGLTAAVTLKVRDTQDVEIAFQMPIYPMIDDTQPQDPDRDIDSPVWNTRLNRLGWGAYLAALNAQGQAIPAYAAPARNRDYSNFPPTITFVGTLEPFHQETAAYVQALRDAQVDVMYQEYEGCYHAFDTLGGQAAVSKEARAFTYDSYAMFYDKYVAGSAEQAAPSPQPGNYQQAAVE